MGAWGYRPFEDDTALDFMVEVEDSDNPQQTLSDSLDSALNTDYLEYTEAQGAIVSAAYIARQVNGTRFSSPDDEDGLDVDTFPDRHPNQDFSYLKQKAAKALRQVLSENSELNELWADNEELYPKWRRGLEELIERLS